MSKKIYGRPVVTPYNPEKFGGGGGGTGKDGASAYEIALEHGFEGDEAAWLASLVGSKGSTGARGKSILSIKTSPNAYATTVNGVSSFYRIASSTVRTEADLSLVDSVKVGDVLLYSYYLYPVVYVDASYVYCGSRINLKGSTGATGARGTGILSITTGPTYYTTNNENYYAIPLSTVKSQAGVSEVKVGDILAYSYYHYPVTSISGDYVQCETRRSIRGATGATGSAGKDGEQGPAGPAGADGGYYIPSVTQIDDFTAKMSFTPSQEGMNEAMEQTILLPPGAKGDKGDPGEKGADGAKGDPGVVYVPSVDADGNLTWTTSSFALPPPSGVNIKGPKGEPGAGAGLELIGSWGYGGSISADFTQYDELLFAYDRLGDLSFDGAPQVNIPTDLLRTSYQYWGSTYSSSVRFVVQISQTEAKTYTATSGGSNAQGYKIYCYGRKSA